MTEQSDRAKRAILVAHGQPSDPMPAEAALRMLARRIQNHLPEYQVVSATLAAPDVLEQVCDAGHGPAVIYPCFMSQGWFTGKVLPQRLGPREIPVLSPLGLDPKLPRLVAGYLQEQMALRGLVAADTELVLAAHGSARGDRAAASARSFATALHRLLPLRAINCCFVEQSPFVEEVAGRAIHPTFCLPFFAQEGDHVRNDITGALGNRNYPGDLLPVVGELPGIARLIADAICSHDTDAG